MKIIKENKVKADKVPVQRSGSAGSNYANKDGVSVAPDAKSASNKNSGPAGENL